MNNTNIELPQGIKDTISIPVAIIVVSLIGGLLYFIYKKCYNYDCFEAMPDDKDDTFQRNICIFVSAVLIISIIFIAILGIWLSFGIMLLTMTLYLGLGVIFYSFHICIIVKIDNR